MVVKPSMSAISVVGANGDETVIGYDEDMSALYLDRTRSGAAGAAVPGFPGVHTAGLVLHHDRLDLRILVDNSIVEVFANDGERVLTDLVYPGHAGDGVRIFAEGGTARLDCLRVDFMRSIWQQS